METEPVSQLYSSYAAIVPLGMIDPTGILLNILVIVVLIFLSAMLSGSENAFFSLTPTDIDDLENRKTKSSQFVLRLINEPDRWHAGRKFLALVLILNNFVNITLIILASFMMKGIWAEVEGIATWVTFAFDVIFITFFLVLFGEVIPKIYATQNNVKLITVTAIPLFYVGKILQPLVWLLTKSTALIDSKVRKSPDNVSLEELNQAIEIASDDDNIEEKNILKGIVNFGNISVKQIMKSRIDVSAVEYDTSQTVLIQKIRDWGYSRVPVYRDNFDNIVGILYIKDLLPLVTNKQTVKWQSLIRTPFFVPANKKIDDLLEEFQEKRTHMAIVVDEYGGSSGIVTMEDILEEIFGDLKDEFDEDELVYSKLDDSTYIFEGKVLLTDMCRIFNVRADYFAEEKGEADTLGGLLMELFKDIPKRADEVMVGNFNFRVESADSRKIKRVKVVYEENESVDDDSSADEA